MKNILSILLLLLAFTACSDKKAVTDVLNRAETLMNEHPDSALNLLRTLTFDVFQKESNRARYALLHSQALDKNYIDVTNDSLISVALEYYKDKDDVRSKFLSYYYMGRVHANEGDNLKAILSYSQAEQLEGEIRDSLALGLLYSQLGDLYREYYDFPKSLDAFRKAEICYGQVSKEQLRLYTLIDQAYILREMGNEDGYSQLLLKVKEQAELLQDRLADEALQRPILTAQRDYLSDRLEVEAYKLRMERNLRVLYILFFIVLLAVVVYVLFRKLKKEKEKARRTIDELNEEMQRKELESHRKVASLLKELEQKSQSDSVIDSLKAELRQWDEHFRQYMRQTNRMQCELEDGLQKKTELLSLLLKERLDFIGSWILLYEDEWVKQDAKEKKILKEVVFWKQKYFSGNKAFSELEKLVNACLDDVMIHFRREIGLPDEADYRRACLLFTGMSAHLVAWVMGETPDAVYQRKSRLRKKVASVSSSHQELFLFLLSK